MGPEGWRIYGLDGRNNPRRPLRGNHNDDGDVFWFENDGNFPTPGWTQRTVNLTAGDARSFVTGDIDNDGDLDIAGAVGTHDIRWYENDGSENFTGQAILDDGANFQESEQVYLIDVNDFFQPRHTKRYILGSDTSKMERIQRHLRGRFTYT